MVAPVAAWRGNKDGNDSYGSQAAPEGRCKLQASHPASFSGSVRASKGSSRWRCCVPKSRRSSINRSHLIKSNYSTAWWKGRDWQGLSWPAGHDTHVYKTVGPWTNSLTTSWFPSLKILPRSCKKFPTWRLLEGYNRWLNLGTTSGGGSFRASYRWHYKRWSTKSHPKRSYNFGFAFVQLWKDHRVRLSAICLQLTCSLKLLVTSIAGRLYARLMTSTLHSLVRPAFSLKRSAG